MVYLVNGVVVFFSHLLNQSGFKTISKGIETTKPAGLDALDKQVEDKERKPKEDKPQEEKPVENKPAENKPAENKPAERKEVKPEWKTVDKKEQQGTVAIREEKGVRYNQLASTAQNDNGKIQPCLKRRFDS